MKYKNIKEGIFLERQNRFIGFVKIDGQIERVHIPNTGRCKEILRKDARVLLEKSDLKTRKTKYSLVSAYKENILINIDSQAPNKIVEEAIKSGKIFPQYKNSYRREVKFLNSRFDFAFYKEKDLCGFCEVKGVTLEENGLAMFPDAPTLRGKKHLLELIEARKRGLDANVLFLIQFKGADSFKANGERDEAFAKTLKKAKEAGVKIHVYDSKVTFDQVEFSEKIKYEI